MVELGGKLRLMRVRAFSECCINHVLVQYKFKQSCLGGFAAATKESGVRVRIDDDQLISRPRVLHSAV